MFKILSIFRNNNTNLIILSRLAQVRLNLERLNSDTDIEHSQARNLLKKEYKSFEDELFSTFASLLHIAKKIAELKQDGFEIVSWYETQLNITGDHLFSVFDYLDSTTYEKLEKFIINFYREPKLSTKTIFDVRDRLRLKKR